MSGGICVKGHSSQSVSQLVNQSTTPSDFHFQSEVTSAQKWAAARWAMEQTFIAFGEGFKQFLNDGAVFAREGMHCPEKNFLCLAGASVVYTLGRTASDSGAALFQGMEGIGSAQDGEERMTAVAAILGGAGSLILLALPPVLSPISPTTPPLLVTQGVDRAAMTISTGAAISGESIPMAGVLSAAGTPKPLRRSGDSISTSDSAEIAEIGKQIKVAEEKLAKQPKDPDITQEVLWLKLRGTYLVNGRNFPLSIGEVDVDKAIDLLKSMDVNWAKAHKIPDAVEMVIFINYELEYLGILRHSRFLEVPHGTRRVPSRPTLDGLEGGNPDIDGVGGWGPARREN